MIEINSFLLVAALSVVPVFGANVRADGPPPKVPRFSVQNMDPSVDPGGDFYRYAAGNWIKSNPVPSDKSRWSGFEELQERNWQLIRGILESSAEDRQATAKSPRGEVGDFFASAMDTNQLEKLGFNPINADLQRIARINSTKALFELLGEFHARGISSLFRAEVTPDAKNSSFYAFEVAQGGLGLPDRDYYLKDDFAQQRKDYGEHITKMLTLLGEQPGEAAEHAALVMEIETSLAKASRTRVELRDPNANYNKLSVAAFVATNSASGWTEYLKASNLRKLKDIIVGQPEFFIAVDKLSAVFLALVGLVGLPVALYASLPMRPVADGISGLPISAHACR